MGKMMKCLIVLMAVCALHNTKVDATLASPHCFSENQPNGQSTGTLCIEGGPSLHEIRNKFGQTIVKNKQKGTYEFAKVDPLTGGLEPIGVEISLSAKELSGLAKGITETKEYLRNHNDFFKEKEKDENRRLEESHETQHYRKRRLQGVEKNLVIPMKFSDHSTRSVPSIGDLNVLMNNAGSHEVCPTGSVRDIFLKSSYGQFDLQSTVVDWVMLPYPESYYADGESGLVYTIHEAICYALNEAEKLINFEDFDTDGDGMIDAITFLHSGYGAEWGGTSEDGSYHTDRIWSHKWKIRSCSGQYGPWTGDDGVSVYEYHISPAIWGKSGSAIGRIGVIGHETGHFLGLPDLYDTNGGGDGVGSYGLMSNSWGFDGSQLYPPKMSPWSQIQVGWLTPTELMASGTYELEPSYSHAEVYRISHGFPSNEYLLIENRQTTGFEAVLPQAGIVIWHIDDDMPNHSTEGYDGQTGWPDNGNHYRVAVAQADGEFDLERGENVGDAGDVFHPGGQTELGPSESSSDPSAGPFPNTDSYQNGQIVQTENRIYDIRSSTGELMEFKYQMGDTTISPTPAPDDTASSPTTDLYIFPDSLYSTYAGGMGQSGNMFEICAKQKIEIRNFDVHCDTTGSVELEVYTKSDSYRDYELDPSAWTRICHDTDLFGNGVSIPTSIPESKCTPVQMLPGECRSFYVTFTSRDMDYTRADAELQPEGSVFSSNTDIDFKVGRGVKYPFLSTYVPRIWNGAINYVKILEKDTLLTTYAGGMGQAGNMFDVNAKQSLTIQTFDVHCDETTVVEVKVFTKIGSYNGFEDVPEAWGDPICHDTNLQGQGVGNPTQIPMSKCTPIEMYAGETRGFYVTFTTRDMDYTPSELPEGSVFASDAYLDYIVGRGLRYPFGGTYSPRAWNGVIHYLKGVGTTSPVGTNTIYPNGSPQWDGDDSTRVIDGEDGGVCFKDDDCDSGVCSSGQAQSRVCEHQDTKQGSSITDKKDSDDRRSPSSGDDLKDKLPKDAMSKASSD